jgi:glycosyltransferase involved in cell wall biosynthesis
MPKNTTTIAIPVYNGASTLPQVFASLEKQNHKNLVKKIIIINDASCDNSLQVIKNYAKKSSYLIKIINHPYSHGLAANYNQALKLTTTPFFTTLHQDIILSHPNSLSLSLSQKSPTVLGVYPLLEQPWSIFNQYNLWQKALFSRKAGTCAPSHSGKFDTYNRELLLNKIGYWNQDVYRTSGEDGDLSYRIKKTSLKMIANPHLIVQHLHNIDPNFSWRHYVQKEMQMNETYGVWFRHHPLSLNINSFALYFRQLLVLGLLIPYFNLLCLILIISYAFAYTWQATLAEKNNPQAYLLPLLNIFILFGAFYYFFKGFIYGRQKL